MLPLTVQATAAQQLKDHTKEQHRAVEALLVPIIKIIHSKEGYIKLLKIFYGFYAPLEINIEKFIDASVVPDIAVRRKAWLILDDLKALDAANGTVAMAKCLPLIDDARAALGAMYVLEGSALGGIVIAKMLQRQTGDDNLPLQFFAGYASQTGPSWQLFVQALNDFARDHQGITPMIDAANQTFLHLKLWIEAQKNDGY